jgi:hypothetical protein
MRNMTVGCAYSHPISATPDDQPARLHRWRRPMVPCMPALSTW